MGELVRSILDFIGQNADWVFPVVFIVSFGESFVFLSLAFPGTSVMLAAGALISSGTVPLWPVLLGGIIGAVLGDAISYGLGRRYGHLTETRWPFTTHPELLPRGYDFFERHGVKSVFIGRFFGPLRAVIPLVAGITKMPVGRFWVANVLSALIWAPALLVPGFIAEQAVTLIALNTHWKAALSVAAMLAVAAGIWLARRLGYLGKN